MTGEAEVSLVAVMSGETKAGPARGWTRDTRDCFTVAGHDISSPLGSRILVGMGDVDMIVDSDWSSSKETKKFEAKSKSEWTDNNRKYQLRVGPRASMLCNCYIGWLCWV